MLAALGITDQFVIIQERNDMGFYSDINWKKDRFERQSKDWA